MLSILSSKTHIFRNDKKILLTLAHFEDNLNQEGGRSFVLMWKNKYKNASKQWMLVAIGILRWRSGIPKQQKASIHLQEWPVEGLVFIAYEKSTNKHHKITLE